MLHGEVLDDAQLTVELFFDHAHRLQCESQKAGLWGDFAVNFRGLVCPGDEDLAEGMASAAFYVDLDGWYGEVRDDDVILSPFAADLEAPTACHNPPPDPVVLRVIENLVEAELLLLDGELSEDALRRVQWALFSSPDPTSGLANLERVLLEMDVVEELFGSAEELISVVGRSFEA